MAIILNVAKRFPFAFGLVYSGVKTQACDLLVQKVRRSNEPLCCVMELDTEV